MDNKEKSRFTALASDDINMLQHIYKSRLNLFRKVMIFLFVSGSFAVFKIRYGEIQSSNIPAIVMNSILVGSFLFITGIVLYRSRIYKIKRDLKNGKKEAINHLVMKKQYFENTGQYFIGLDHPDYLFYEIDFDTWQKLSIGDVFTTYRAPLSKYMFNPQGKFSII